MQISRGKDGKQLHTVMQCNSPTKLPRTPSENVDLACLGAAKNTTDVIRQGNHAPQSRSCYTPSNYAEKFSCFQSKNALDSYTVLGIMKLRKIASSSTLVETLHKSLQHNKTPGVWFTWYGHYIKPPVHPQSDTVSVFASSSLVGMTYCTSTYQSSGCMM